MQVSHRSLIALATVALGAMPLHADLGDQITKLIPQGFGAGTIFGTSVAISDSFLLVGSPGFDSGPNSSTGAVFVFDPATGVELNRLELANPVEFDSFGVSLSIAGSLAIIGATGRDAAGKDSGAAYLYDIASGTQLAELLPSSPANPGFFGFSVATDGVIAVVGAKSERVNDIKTGAAYTFDVATGQLLARLTAADGDLLDGFGTSVAISGTTAVVGADGESDLGTASGAVYLFDALTGAESAKLTPSVVVNQAQFGDAVAVNGTNLFVGAPYYVANGVDSGAVFLFDLTLGSELKLVTPSDPVTLQKFGFSLALTETTLLVGADGDIDQGIDSGSAYFFDIHTLIELAKVTARDGNKFDNFGNAVGLSDSVAIVGAVNTDENGLNSGSAYLFDGSSPAVPAATVSRNGSGVNASLLTSITDPVLGQDWETDVDTAGHAPAFAALEVFGSGLNGTFLSGGELLVDLSSPFLLGVIQFHFGGIERFSITLPPDASLFGLGASTQAAVFGAPGYELSNALDLVVGY